MLGNVYQMHPCTGKSYVPICLSLFPMACSKIRLVYCTIFWVILFADDISSPLVALVQWCDYRWQICSSWLLELKNSKLQIDWGRQSWTRKVVQFDTDRKTGETKNIVRDEMKLQWEWQHSYVHESPPLMAQHFFSEYCTDTEPTVDGKCCTSHFITICVVLLTCGWVPFWVAYPYSMPSDEYANLQSIESNHIFGAVKAQIRHCAAKCIRMARHEDSQDRCRIVSRRTLWRTYKDTRPRFTCQTVSTSAISHFEEDRSWAAVIHPVSFVAASVAHWSSY